MDNYEIGKYYNFWVTGLKGKRICLANEEGNTFSVFAYDFQTDWDWASSQVPVEVISCYVKAIDSVSGYISLQQNREFLLRTLYSNACSGTAELCTFIIKELTTINDKLFYVVLDSYGLTHLFLPEQNGNYMCAGEEIKLVATGLKSRNNNNSALTFVTPDKWDFELNVSAEDEENTGIYGDETDTKEFKSTIVYPAGATGPDIDTQMEIILQTIAGFMNAKGGVLYIGVNDNGDVVGIESEYTFLNLSKKDKKCYQQNKDGYQNKIRSGIIRHLGPVAQDYVTFSFPQHDEHTVCEVTVEESHSVIWYDEREAYKRTGNRTTHLRAEAINKLILDKCGMYKQQSQIVKNDLQTEDEVLTEQQESIEIADEKLEVVKVPMPTKVASKGVQRVGNGSFYMNLFSNGEWSWSKDVPSDDDLEFCVPINSPASKNDLYMVYEDGCVNRVDAYHLHLNRGKECHRYSNGRRNDGVKLLKAFAAKEDDMLACFCKQDGHPFVKAHPNSHVSRHEIMNLKGNILINVAGKPNVEYEDICFVASQHRLRVSSLFKTENQTANCLGFQMDLNKNSKYQETVKTLRSLCDVVTYEE